MNITQEVKKFLANQMGIPEASLDKYAAGRPQALEIKDSNIYLDGVIIDSATAKIYESWGYDLNFVTPEKVRAALGKFNQDVTLWINSPGGSVFDASSILTAMQRFQQDYKVNVVVDGVCASAATYLAVHGDDRKMAKLSMFMIHNSWSRAVGDADDFEKAASTLNKIDKAYAEMLAEHSNLSEEEVRDAMKEETWYSAKEAVEAGFIDHVFEPKKVGDNSPPKQTTTQKLTTTIQCLNELRGYY